MAGQFSRYTVRVPGPSGVVIEKAGVVGARFAYPPDAPPLVPGTRYGFEVQALGHPVQATTFEVLDPARAGVVKAELRELNAALAGASPNALAVAKAGALANTGLLHDARLVVLAALARDPDEPTLPATLLPVGAGLVGVGVASRHRRGC